MNATPQRPPGLTPVGNFAVHGRVRTEVSGQLAISYVQGPWNMELVQAWVAAFREQQDLLLAMPAMGGHAALLVVEGSALATHDAIALMRKVSEYSVGRYALRLGAVVLPDGVEGRQLAPRTLAPIFQGVVPYQFFHTLEDARAWAENTLRPPVAAQ